MLQNYLKMAWRSIFNQRLYSFINIGGLAVGLTCFLLIFLYVRHELSYDRFLDGADRIYRIYQRSPGNEYLGKDKYAYTTAGLAPAMNADIPEIRKATTIRDQSSLLGYEEIYYYEDGLWADENFFSVFPYEMITGNPATALQQKKSIVLTESLARKLFGSKNPVGKTLEFRNRDSYTVTGLMPDLPLNASVRFSFICGMQSNGQYTRDMERDPWGNNDFYTYFALAEGADVQTVADKLLPLVERYREKAFGRENLFEVQAWPEVHFDTTTNFDIGSKGNYQYVGLFSLVAILVLLLACANYMNLAIARSIKRATEVGVRKVVGARQKQLIGQFLGESVLIAFLALLLALAFTNTLAPLFGHFLDRPLRLRLFKEVWLWPVLLLLVIGVGVLAGSYPAFLMSSLRPVQVLKGKVQGRLSGMKLQRMLMVGQYAVSIILIICSLVVFFQFRYIQDKELGYNKEHVITISALDFRLSDHIEALKNEWETHPSIVSVTTSAELPTNVTSGTMARNEGVNVEDRWMIYRARHSYDFLDVFGIELVAGRDFSEEVKTDSANARILNESAAAAFGWTPEEAIGQTFIESKRTPKTVIGVVKDFHMHSMHMEIAPLMLQLEGYFEHIAVKVRPDNLSETIAFLEESMQQYSSYPFEYQFLDERFDQLYQTDARLGEMFGFFTLLSIVIASLGLFGLAAFITNQRTKEIGIRKVLGASVRDIVGMLSKDFLRLVLIGFLLAVPIAWYSARLWLADFAYRIDLEWWVFALGGFIAMAIAFFTVASQSLQTALSNPVNALKSE